MVNAYLKPLTKGSTAPIAVYRLEYVGDNSVDGKATTSSKMPPTRRNVLGTAPLVQEFE
jgi:hypothetical protein